MLFRRRGARRWLGGLRITSGVYTQLDIVTASARPGAETSATQGAVAAKCVFDHIVMSDSKRG